MLSLPSLNLKQDFQPLKNLTLEITSLKHLKPSKFEQFKQLTPQLNISNSRECLKQRLQRSNNQFKEPTQFTNTYQELEVLGSGCQSICKKISNISTGELRVAKINQLALDDEIFTQLKEEGQILSKLDNENIIKAYEFYQTSSTFIQIIEFIDAQSLQNKLQSHAFTEEEIILIAYRLLKALKEIHQKQIIHRDITLSNILYSKSKNILKLIDFGVAKQYCEESVMNISSAGNPDFKAPEMIQEKAYNEKIDSWGLGLVLYSLIQKRIIGSKIVMRFQKFQQRLKFPEGVSVELQDLICGLLKTKKKERLSVEQALELPVFSF